MTVMAQRFGPINPTPARPPPPQRPVLARAKDRMEIFSSMRAADVVGVGARRGIAALRSFLRVRGNRPTPALTVQLALIGEPESDFEVAVDPGTGKCRLCLCTRSWDSRASGSTSSSATLTSLRDIF